MSVLRWWSGLVVAFGLLIVLRFVLPLPFNNEIIIFAIYVMGCNFLLGRVGFISFGQPAYLASGAYGAAFYLYYFGTNPYVGILVGIVAGLLVAALVGPLFVRLRSDYFALVNLALAVIIFFMMQKMLASVTFGDNGLELLTRMDSTPVLDITRPADFWLFAFLCCFGIWALYKYLDDSVFGACCLAAKANEDKLRFLGYSNYGIRLMAFVVANTTTAFAGALYAIHQGLVSPEMSSPARAADPVVVTILGGVGTLYGPLVGSIAFVGMKDLISKMVGHWELIVGFLLVFVMLAGERGIWGSLEPLLRRLVLRQRDADAPAETAERPADAGVKAR